MLEMLFAKRNLVSPILALIVLCGAVLSIGYAITLEKRMLNENYVGMKESFEFLKNNASKNDIVVFHSPIHLYLNTGLKGTADPSLADKISAKYVVIDGWDEYSATDFKEFDVVFQSKNKTSMVLKKTS